MDEGCIESYELAAATEETRKRSNEESENNNKKKLEDLDELLFVI